MGRWFTNDRQSAAPTEQRSIENPSTPITPAELSQILGTGYRTAAGVTVNQDTALRLAAVLACVRNIAESIATLPIDVVAADGPKTRQVRPPRWLEDPNGEMTRPEWVENMLTSALLDGNSYNQLVRDGSDVIQEIWPLNPAAVSAQRDPRTARLVYQVSRPIGGTFPLDGLVSSARGSVAFGDMLHMRAFRSPGAIRGLSVIEYERQTIGVGMAAEQFGAQFFGNGAHLSGNIEVPGKLSVEAAQILLATWGANHGGLAHAHEPGVTTEGAKWVPISVPPDQAQYINTREFSVTDIARMYRVPPHKIGDLTHATYSNVEHLAIEWVVDCLMPWIVRLEHAITRLLPMGQAAKVNVKALLRGDMMSRYNAYDVARRGGWLSPNDILALEDEDPLPGDLGTGYLRPLNMAEAGKDISSKGLLDKAVAAFRLVQAGYDPADVLKALDLPAMEHIESAATLTLPPDPTLDPEPVDPDTGLPALAASSNGNGKGP